MTAALWYVGGKAVDDRRDLRYSLRSFEQNAHDVDEVWIVGDVPSWVRNARTIPLLPQSEKFANARASITAFVEHPDAPDEFYLCNDDHFIVEPVPGELPAVHLGPTSVLLDSILGPGVRRTGNTATKALRDTAAWLAACGHGDVLAYYAHTPLRFNTALMRKALADYPASQRVEPFLLYAVAGAGGVGSRVGNAKVKAADNLQTKLDMDMPYLSTNDETFPTGAAGRYIRSLFPNPSKYEEA